MHLTLLTAILSLTPRAEAAEGQGSALRVGATAGLSYLSVSDEMELDSYEIDGEDVEVYDSWTQDTEDQTWGVGRGLSGLRVSYRFVPGFEVGLLFTMGGGGKGTEKEDIEGETVQDEDSESSWYQAAPYVAYRFQASDTIFIAPMLLAGRSFESTGADDSPDGDEEESVKTETSASYYGAGVEASFFLGERVSVDLGGVYARRNITDSFDVELSDGKYSATFEGEGTMFGMFTGISIYFSK